ncbi:MAG: UDP-N-acetylmuramate--alanine ligase [Candidatus Rokuibacteriota bacterium]|nr:MAG: UDP-N-acetylmuramate--alanine ligase [Candidatus Rokubacteria bacterium]
MSENPVRSAVRGDDLKTAVAASAARWIAEEGCDYATAKRRAVRELLGEAAGALGAMPDNALVESELRRYLRLFAADSQPAQLATLRRLALRWMRRLHEFNPHLVGAVLNGTATGHSGIHLNLYTDSAKDVEIFLLNQSQSFDVRDAGPNAETTQEVLEFLVRAPQDSGLDSAVGVTLSVMDPVALRVAPAGRAKDPDLHPVERAGRANVSMVERLLAETDPQGGGSTV